VFGKCNSILTACITLFFFSVIAGVPASGQVVLFDFDNAPLHSSLPIDQTASGIAAHFSATGQGFSIQDNSAPVVPVGFTGRFIYPNSIYLADLLIHFDQALADFSIMYSCQELGCDDAATIRVTAYMSGSFVGTNTKTASNPGTWPVDTLSCSFPQGFDSVVVHYDSRPPTCQDYGVIFLADNMRVTPLSATAISDPGGELPEMFMLRQNYPNPFNPSTTISYRLPTQSIVTLKIFDLLGREVATLVNDVEPPGYKSVNFTANNLVSGVYYYRLVVKAISLGEAGNFVETKKLVLL